MNPAVHPSITTFTRHQTDRRRPTRTVFLPKEHGSWSLALEPIIFGLVIFPSPATCALALSATAAFFTRRPLKTLMKGPDHASMITLSIFCTIMLTGLAQVVALSGITSLWPLIPAIPMSALHMYLERKHEGRAAGAELAGSGIFALVPAAMATLNGHDAIFAFSLSALMLARSAPAILTVRTLLRRRKGQRANRFAAVGATVVSVSTITLLAREEHVPTIAQALVLLSSFRLALLFGPTPRWSAKRIGMTEAIFGVIYILIIGLSYY